MSDESSAAVNAIRTLAVGDETLLIRQAGRTGSPPVLLLHSLGTSSELWLPQLQILADRFQVIAMDLRGHGGSSNYGGFSVQRCASDAFGIIKSLGLTNVHLVGLSMGGLIAPELAVMMKRDKTVKCMSMVLACSYRTLKGPQSQARLNATREALSNQDMASFASTYMNDTACASMPVDARQRLERCIAAMNPQDYLQTLEEILFYDAGDSLADVQDVPTLVLSGALDRKVSMDALNALIEAVPRARHARLENAGHLANVEDPQGFTNAVVDFWNTAAKLQG